MKFSFFFWVFLSLTFFFHSAPGFVFADEVAIESHLGFVNRKTINAAEKILNWKLKVIPERIYYYFPKPGKFGEYLAFLRIKIPINEFQRFIKFFSMKVTPFNWVYLPPQNFHWWKIFPGNRLKIYDSPGNIEYLATYLDGEMYFCKFRMTDDSG